MGIDLDYFEKRVRSLEQALERLQHLVGTLNTVIA